MRSSYIPLTITLLLPFTGCSQAGVGAPNSLPDWVYSVGLLLIFCAIPAAYGASISYDGPRFDEGDFGRSLRQGASLPAGVGTLLGCGAVGIWFFSEIVGHAGGNLSPMEAIVLFFTVIALIVGSFVVSAAAAIAGGYGARLGAQRGKAVSVLGAAIGAMMGAAAIPLFLSLS